MNKSAMKTKLLAAAVLAAGSYVAVTRAFAEDKPASIAESFRLVEVASVADATEQLYGRKCYMSHDMRPLNTAKFAGPAVTVLLTKDENEDGSKALNPMLDVIDQSAPGSVYVMVLEDGLDYAGLGGLMGTAMKVRSFAGAVVDGGVRDTPQLTKLQFPVFSRGVVPSTTVNHFRVGGVNVPVKCAGVDVRPGDIVSADGDGVAVIRKEQAGEVLAKARQLDETEHGMFAFIEKYRSIREAVAKFGRL